MRAEGKPVRPGRKWLALAAVCAGGLALDQLTKFWAWQTLRGGGQIPIWRGILSFNYVENPVVAFSLLGNLPAGWRPIVVFCLQGLALAALLYLAWRWRRRPVWTLLPLAFILAGAAGNLIDRLLRGGVVDFLQIHYWNRWSWPIFNLADLLIDAGLILVIISQWRQAGKQRKAEQVDS